MDEHRIMNSHFISQEASKAKVPEAWLYSPPTSLAVGDGVYARALASVLGCDLCSPANLLAKPAEISGRAYPQVLGSLERVFLVAGSANGAAELLQWHKGLWEWVMRLSRNGDQQDLAMIFILPAAADATLVQSLLTGLALNGPEPHLHGHVIVHMEGGLQSLISSIGKIRPMDLVALDARRRADVRHTAIGRLLAALSKSDYRADQEAIRAVAAAFKGAEYQLDLFCRAPAHRNGNALRQWLAASVTGQVTPEQWRDQRSAIAGRLVFPQNDLIS